VEIPRLISAMGINDEDLGLLSYLYSRLGVPRKALFGKKCVCDLGEKGEHGRFSWLFVDVLNSI
jgi:hypothetical protein